MQVILNEIFVVTDRIDVIHMSGWCNQDPGMTYTRNWFLNKLRKIDTIGRISPREASQTDKNGFTNGKSSRNLKAPNQLFFYASWFYDSNVSITEHILTDVIWATKCLRNCCFIIIAAHMLKLFLLQCVFY